jgi:hypothetical protein
MDAVTSARAFDGDTARERAEFRGQLILPGFKDFSGAIKNLASQISAGFGPALERGARGHDRVPKILP